MSTRKVLSIIMTIMIIFLTILLFLNFKLTGSSQNYYTKVGPKYPPSKGEVWPAPQWEKKNPSDYFVYNTKKFDVAVKSYTCGLLTRAIDRFKKTLYNMELIQRNNTPKEPNLINGTLRKLNIKLYSKCEELPQYDMDERYNLSVGKTSELKSKSIWGILRGLETFTQLLYFADDYSEIRINVTTISDFPSYKHRGLLIDTSRHYLSLANIYKTIDALAMNKMNVLHWHLIDDQSFPYQSERYPTLSKKGAFYPTMVYTKEDILSVVAFARDRGVRVVPEIDVPGHTLSWGEAFPDLLTKCYSWNSVVVGLGPLDPTKSNTFAFLEQLFDEVHHWFPDEFLHLGGDEVQTNCWESNPDIQDFLKKNGLVISQLQGYFMQKTIALLPKNTRPMVWQEVFDMDALPKHKTHVQVWNWQWVDEMVKILKAGHYVIFSASWYLDYGKEGWQDYYRDDPRQMVYKQTGNKRGLEDIVGGEACLWGEMADDTNLLTKTWPRTSAIAERLWSGLPYDSGDPVNNKVRARIEEQTCRMRRRGIPAEPPNGPSFCVGALP